LEIIENLEIYYIVKGKEHFSISKHLIKLMSMKEFVWTGTLF
jgi:hypothetical protein